MKAKPDAIEQIARIVSPRTTRPMGQDDWIRMRHRVRLAVWRLLRERAEAAVDVFNGYGADRDSNGKVAGDIRAAVLGRKRK